MNTLKRIVFMEINILKHRDEQLRAIPQLFMICKY